MRKTRRKIEKVLKPIEEDLFNAILWYNGTFKSCGYAASIVTSLLQQALPEHQVRLGYGHMGPDRDLKHHFWTEVDTSFVDATYGQFDPRRQYTILIGDQRDLPGLRLTRFDRKRPEAFSALFHAQFDLTITDLINKPDDPFVPGFEQIWEPHKRQYTLDTIERLQAKIKRK